ncbi:MAG TPA: PASTA domain-containing protein [Gaiellaceae bacterium]|nr:PASTA domain-containing protein [Gaiellaceae bacterium]
MRRGLVVLIVCALVCGFASAASADWAGSDPVANFHPDLTCTGPATGAACINQAVYYLDQARASLGQPAYKLPADFPSLTPVEQMFILTNLDRILYGLPPVLGLSATLNNDALVTGVQAEADPSPSLDDWNSFTANWAGGYPNAPFAYEGWMYDDGPGSTNADCTPTHTAGCWGHRHDILWEFDPSDVLVMGAATGTGPDGSPGYAMLLFGGNPDFTPDYTYTWAQAVADGAGTNAYNPGSGQPTTHCVVPTVIGRKLTAAKRLIATGHCTVGKIVWKYTRYTKGSVLGQKPAPGKQLAEGAKLTLVVSKGLRRR